MRPVNKGEAPKIQFKKYQEAEPYLEERLGLIVLFANFRLNMYQR